MYRFFVSPEQIGEKTVTITGSDVKHIRSVLRMRAGEQIYVCTGAEEREYCCALTRLDAEEIEARILRMEEGTSELPVRITLFQGLPKSDKMEWIIQKGAELGVFAVVPVSMRRSVVKLSDLKARERVRRWNAVSESAAKQSKRMYIPQVEQVCSFQKALERAKAMDTILAPYERAADMEHTRQVLGQISPGQRAGIFIGPEGGFEEEEIAKLREAGAQIITLGRRILRTETAGIAVLSALMLQLEGKEHG